METASKVLITGIGKHLLSQGAFQTELLAVNDLDIFLSIVLAQKSGGRIVIISLER